MLNTIRLLAVLALGFLLLTCQLTADEDPAKKPVKPKTDKPVVDVPKDSSSKPPTFKVEKGPFKIDVVLKGVFESGDMTEVSLGNLEAWTPQTGGQLIVRKALEHGAPVRKGEPIIWLDHEKIDRAISDLENDLQQSAHALKLAEEELPIIEKAVPLDLAVTERVKKMSDEDLKRWTDEDRPWLEKSANYMVKRSQQWLDYAKEELRQLQKMYKAKDLTEETEEIILRRQRNQVEMAEFYLKESEMERDQALKIFLPRREQLYKDLNAKLTLDLQKAQTTLPLTVIQKRLALSKLRYEFDKSATRLAKLKRDRDMMTVKAPADGTVYHGKCVRGQWQAGGGAMDRLAPGTMLQGHEVLLTIVKTRPIFVRAVVEEKDLRHLRNGLAGKVVPASFPDMKLAGKVERVLPIPVTAEKFDARIAVQTGKEAEPLVPGMACSVKFVPYVKENALTVPASAVFTDDLDEDKHYVYLQGKDGKPEKRNVTVGPKTDKRIEIREGLKEGDEILQEKPGDKKADGPAKETKP